MNHSGDWTFPRWQTNLRLLSSAARCQREKGSWWPWTALSSITVPPDLLSCGGSWSEEPSWTALSTGRYRRSTQRTTDWCYWPLCPLLCHTRWNQGSDVKSTIQEPELWPLQRICMWHVGRFGLYLYVSCASLHLTVYCFVIHSSTKRCKSWGPDSDRGGGGHCFIGLLV